MIKEFNHVGAVPKVYFFWGDNPWWEKVVEKNHDVGHIDAWMLEIECPVGNQRGAAFFLDSPGSPGTTPPYFCESHRHFMAAQLVEYTTEILVPRVQSLELYYPG